MRECPEHCTACIPVPDIRLSLLPVLSVFAVPIVSPCLISWRPDGPDGRDGSLAPTCGARWIFRALTLWSYDQSFSVALDVAKALSKPVEYLMTLWPCPGTSAELLSAQVLRVLTADTPCLTEQRRRWAELREKLNSSCFAASVPLLSAPPSAPSNQAIREAIPNLPTQG